MRPEFRIAVLACTLAVPSIGLAKVGADEANKLGTSLMPLGGDKKASGDGSVPAWDGGWTMASQPKGKERDPSIFPGHSDKPLYTITKADVGKYADKLTAGQKALFDRFGDSYKMIVYPSHRTVAVPDWVAEATKKNALNASLANEGESLQGAATGIPFPIPKSGKEVIWNHKLRYRGESIERYNAQLAVQSNGAFQPYVLREDVLFQYNRNGMKPEALEKGNIVLYFLQFTTAPVRQAGNVLLVHETMDQVKEARKAWLYNPGQRRIRLAPNVAYDNPGTGSDGLRTNDQLDAFNGATDRYTWKLVGKKEMIMPYNSHKLFSDELKYDDIAKKGHMNQDLPRYEMHRVWVVDATLNAGTSHIYKRRTFYVDEDSWTILAVDCYDKRDQLWRVQETHQVQLPWWKQVGPVAGTVYDLQSDRYLIQELSNEEEFYKQKEFDLDHFTTGSVKRMAKK